MDDSKFYRDWLDMDVPAGVTPTYYQLLGLPHLEKRIPQIQAAIRSRMEHFRQIDFGENREVYARLLQLLVEARFVLLTAELKREYDMRCSQEGKKQWQTYERPSRLARLKQAGMISAAFMLGLSISLVMAMTVARNPDGTVKYAHPNTVAQKTEWFTTPPGKEFPRPSNTSRRPPEREKSETPSTSIPETSTVAISTPTPSSLSSGTEEDMEVRMTPRLRPSRERRSPVYGNRAEKELEKTPEKTSVEKSETSMENPNQESGLETPLPETVATQQVTPEGKVPEVQVETLPALQTTPGDSLIAESAEDLPTKIDITPLPDEQVSQTVPETGVPLDAAEKAFAKADNAFENQSEQAESLWERAKALPLEDAERSVLFRKALDLAVEEIKIPLVFSILETMGEKYDLPMLAQKKEVLQSLTKKLAPIAPTLEEKQLLVDLDKYGWEVCNELIEMDQCEDASKIYDEIYQVCDSCPLSTLKKDVVFNKKTFCNQMNAYYQNYLTASRTLETNPEDASANWIVGLWYLQKKEDLPGALPYFVHCPQKDLRKMAQKELETRAALSVTPQKTLEIADGWWEIARLFPKGIGDVIYNHATVLYEKIDRERLNQGEQIRVVERIEKQRK